MITKADVFPIKNRQDAAKVQNIMESIAGSENQEELEVFEILLALMRDWSSKQPRMSPPEPHEIIKGTLELCDISQARLAEMIGTSETAICAIVNGRRPITPKMARKIAQALGLSYEHLLPQKRAA
jgi:plasmid maintenance system antidote protein VapI